MIWHNTRSLEHGITVDKKTFIATYVANFMACHAATSYVQACMSGTQENLYNKEMIEGAEFLGLQIWEKMSREFKDVPDPYFSGTGPK
jgi:hypothetical protein